jgi:hypothetical protein
MLDNLLRNFSSYLPNPFTAWDMTNQQLMIIFLFTAASGYVMTRITHGVKVITWPVCFAGLFIAAMFSNWFFKDFYFYAITEIQKTFILTAVGQAAAALFLMLGFRTENVR